MTLDEWFDQYRPIVNESGESGLIIDDKHYMFETYAPDIDRVLEATRETPNNVWTLLDGDDGEPYLVDGFHFVNRQGYFLTEIPYTGEESICISYLD